MQVDGITAPIEELATLAITSAESPFKTNNQAANTAFNAPPPAIANNAAPPATIPKPGAVPANLAALAAEHPRPYVPDWDAVHEAYQAWEGETQPTQAYDPHMDSPIFSPEGSNGGGGGEVRRGGGIGYPGWGGLVGGLGRVGGLGLGR